MTEKSGSGIDQERSTARTGAPSLISRRAIDAVVAEQIFGAVCQQGGPDFLYPDVADGFIAGLHTLRSYSSSIDAAWTILDRIHLRTRTGDRMWLFSRRTRFYEALGNRCTINESRRLLRVAWPAAMGVFR